MIEVHAGRMIGCTRSNDQAFEVKKWRGGCGVEGMEVGGIGQFIWPQVLALALSAILVT